MQSTKTASKRKSIRLTAEERKALKKWVAGFVTEAEAAEELSVHQSTLARLLLIGQASPSTVEVVRNTLKNAA